MPCIKTSARQYTSQLRPLLQSEHPTETSATPVLQLTAQISSLVSSLHNTRDNRQLLIRRAWTEDTPSLPNHAPSRFNSRRKPIPYQSSDLQTSPPLPSHQEHHARTTTHGDTRFIRPLGCRNHSLAPSPSTHASLDTADRSQASTPIAQRPSPVTSPCLFPNAAPMHR